MSLDVLALLHCSQFEFGSSSKSFVNTFLASGTFCHLLLTFANSFGSRPGQDRHSGSKQFDALIVFLKDFFEKLILKKVSRR